MAVNYDQVIDEMRAAGLLVDHLELDTGKTTRCYTEHDREKRGWYRLSQHSIGDDLYIIGAFGIWRGNDNGKIAVKPKAKSISREERDAINARIAADAKKAKAQRDAEAGRASRKASMVWRKYQRDGQSDYLQRKGVQGHGTRYHESGTIAIPMMDQTGKVWGLQIIRGKNRGDKLEKQYWPKGLSKQGHYHLIGGYPRDLVLIAEGYATAASLFEATGIPCVVAFDANNLLPVGKAINKAYPRARMLFCADDDYRTDGNPGVKAANTAAMAVEGEIILPEFAEARPEDKKGPTDFNDLHALEGIGTVRAQIEARLSDLGWVDAGTKCASLASKGGGDGDAMPPRLSVDDAVVRFWGTYGLGGKVLFDQVDRRLVHKDDAINLLPRHGWEDLKSHPSWRVARDTEIGFDPTEKDPIIRCNLFGGWEMKPRPGKCTALLELLEYLCNNENNGRDVYEWVLKWLAYPLQNRGAKMHSAIVVHGPQGTGKSRFFEAIVKIYGQYGRLLGQEALEDKFNADWAEKKLFILADEILARADMYHIKNRLKGFITGDTIRVNPKNVAAHNEKNQMNIVFLSNEHMPTVLENDDRRHCVIWVPPKLPDAFFAEVTDEIDNGGAEALFHHLMDLPLGDFKPWTKPPMTSAKQDLINLGISSNERFIQEWMRLEVEGPDGDPAPFCPCQGSHLYKLYERWCRVNGEIRPRPSNHFIGHLTKIHGWTAGRSERTYHSLHPDKVNGGHFKNRKMVVPSEAAVQESVRYAGEGSVQHQLIKRPDENKSLWLTRGFFAFENAIVRSE